MIALARRRIAVLAIGVMGWSLVGAALAPAARPQPAAPPPAVDAAALDWLRAAATALGRVSYRGTRTSTVWAGRVQAVLVRVYHQAPDRTRLEYLAVGDQPARIVVIDGGAQTTYVRATNRIIRSPAARTDEEALTQQILPQIAENYTVRFAGVEQVAGRAARVIDVQSRFPGRPRLRVWVDVGTRLILRFERYGPGGALNQASAFINIQINPTFPPGLFEVTPPPGAQIETRRPPAKLAIEQIASRVGFTPQLPAYLPAGYKLVGSRVVALHEVPTAVFAFTDGVATLTLFESLGAQGAPPNAQQVQVDGVSGMIAARGVANVLHWNARGVSFTLVGDLPSPEMVRVGASLRSVGSLRTPMEWDARARAWLAAILSPLPAEAAASGPQQPSAVPPVPVSPYITNNTHVIGSGIAAEEKVVWRALAARGLTPFVVKVTVASDGVTKLSDGRLARLAWVWFVYGMDWTGGAGAAVREVQASAYALSTTALRADPRVTRVLLTGYFHRSGRFDGRRTDATFTAQVARARLLDGGSDPNPGAALARAGDIWYSPVLLAGDLVEPAAEPHDPHLPAGERVRLPRLPGDRTAESTETFHGGLFASVVETKRRLQGLLFGGENQGRVWRGTPLRREIALTFDDGPSPVATPLLLAILRRYDAHATFFVIGEHAQAYPYLLREMAADGDEIGDHTFHHPNMTSVDDATVAQEIEVTRAVIEHAASRWPRWFRPPGGDYTDAVVAAAHRAGLGLAMWTDNSGDWALPPAKVVVDRVLAHAEPGGIVLLHNGTLNTVRALPSIIVELQRRGYRLVTVSQLMQDAQ
ncbi:MAG TPA: polysaccharide deacetylase family protein [bacterium]|nr:polysaccharide deacetylase family protein [bacterium]